MMMRYPRWFYLFFFAVIPKMSCIVSRNVRKYPVLNPFLRSQQLFFLRFNFNTYTIYKKPKIKEKQTNFLKNDSFFPQKQIKKHFYVNFIVTAASTRAEASNGVVFVVTAISKDEERTVPTFPRISSVTNLLCYKRYISPFYLCFPSVLLGNHSICFTWCTGWFVFNSF